MEKLFTSENLYTLAQVAAIIGHSTKWVLEWVHCGYLLGKKTGSACSASWRFSANDLNAWWENLPENERQKARVRHG